MSDNNKIDKIYDYIVKIDRRLSNVEYHVTENTSTKDDISRVLTVIDGYADKAGANLGAIQI